MWIYSMGYIWIAQTLVWAIIFFISGLSTMEALHISPCGPDGVREAVADQEIVFVCAAEGKLEWRLRFYGMDTSELVATCENTCNMSHDFKSLMTTNVVKSGQSSRTNIKPARAENFHLLINSSLECVQITAKDQQFVTTVVRCQLNYVYPPEGASCTAVNTSWSVTVLCIIRSVYSSHRVYTCQLHRLKQESKNQSLETVTMVTSPTTDTLSKTEVKVSGSCQFSTSLPAEEGRYRFFVSVSPGGLSFSAKHHEDHTWIMTERPASPNVSCNPHPYVPENANVTCRCSSTNLGQPLGRLMWIVGNKTNKGTSAGADKQLLTPHGLYFTQMLTLSDQGQTWFRCDVIWGTRKFPGGNYTAHVGYAAKQPSFLLNGQDQSLTVREGDQLHFVCESDGRPVSQLSTRNNDNDTVIWRDMSPINVTSVAHCNDTATYSCSAQNEISTDVMTSLSITLDVSCKPRSLSPSRLQVVSDDMEVRLHFDVIANPVPQQGRLWLNNSNGSYSEIEVSKINITCSADKNKRYLSRCSLAVFNASSLSMTGAYLLRVSNAVGEENFAVEIISGEGLGQEGRHTILLAVGGCVVGAVVLAASMFIVIIRKIKKAPNRKRGQDQLEVVPVTSQAQSSQVPLYAVVDKTNKKPNSRPAQTLTVEEEMHTPRTAGAAGPEPGCSKEIEVLYAVVDKVRSKSPGRWNQVYLMGEESWYMNGNATVVYQNDVQQLPVRPLSQNEATDEKGRLPRLASRCDIADDGRWVNHDGLTYTLPVFDVTDDVGRCPVIGDDGTDYCSLRVFESNLPAHDQE